MKSTSSIMVCESNSRATQKHITASSTVLPPTGSLIRIPGSRPAGDKEFSAAIPVLEWIVNANRSLLVLFLVLLSMPLSSLAQKRAVLPEEPVARVGVSVITARDLRVRLEAMPFPGKQTKAEIESVKSKTLYAMIAEKVLAQEAYRLGLGQDQKTALMTRELENVLIRDELYKQEIVAKARPSRQEILEGMTRIVKEVQVLSFIVRSEHDAITLAELLLKCKPQRVIQSLPTSIYTQVDTITIRFGAPDTAFENAAYSIGSSRISRPAYSPNFGWAVLYLLGRRTYKPAVELSLPDRQRRVEQIIQGRHEQDRVAEYSLEVLKDRNANADSALFTMLADSISALWKEDTIHFKSRGVFILTSDLVDLIMTRMQPLLPAPFVRIDDGDLTLGELLEMFRYLDFQSTFCEGITFLLDLNSAVKDLVARELIAREGRRQGLHFLKSVQDDLQMWRGAWAARSLYYRVRDSLKVTEENIVAHLVKNKAVFGPYYEVNVREVLSASLADAAKVLDELDRGRSLSEVASQSSARKEWARNGGESGFIRVVQHPEIGFHAMMADTGQLVGPLRLAEGYSVFKVLGKRRTKEAIVGFDTLRENVRTRLLTEKRKETLERYVAGLAHDQQVSIDYQALQKVRSTQIPVFTRRLIGFGGRMSAFPLLMQMWDWINEFRKPPTIMP